MPYGVPAARGKVTATGPGSGGLMSNSSSRRFPLTVTHLPVTHCKTCRRTVACRPGKGSDVLTRHYRRAHPEALGVPSR